MSRLLVFLFAIGFGVHAHADISSVNAEPKPEKRAEKALDNAETALKSAEQAYTMKGDAKETDTALSEVAESVNIAYDSLKGTGKNASKSPKHFKKAEIRTRELLRRLDDFRQQMSVDDRGEVDKVRAAVQAVHENLLAAIMGGKKR